MTGDPGLNDSVGSGPAPSGPGRSAPGPSDAVLYEVRSGVAWLTINRPEARNALNQAARDGLLAGVQRFNADDSAHVLVLTGAGDQAFCAGGDLKEMAATQLKVPPPEFVMQFGRTIEVAKPTIAAVNGVAYAGGFLLAQNCDLAIAADTARFAISEVKVGRGAPWAAPLPWLIPPRVAMQILLTGDPIDAARAYQIGMVNEVVPLAELAGAAQAMAERIAANAPLSVRAAKRTVRLIAELPLAQAYTEADRIWEPVYLSEDAQEGPAAFAARRPPVWRGK
jgi:enoyl-CoA hydratase/carnithine racemase